MTEKLTISNPAYHCRSGTEHGHQVALMVAVAQIKHLLPDLPIDMLHAIPNGGTRGTDQKSAMIAGGILKAEGVKAGVSDLFLPVARWQYHGLYIEMKKPGGVESAKQIEWGDKVKAQGYWYQCCYSWHDALRLLMNYLQFELPPSLDWSMPDRNC